MEFLQPKGEYYIIPPNSGYARHLDRRTKGLPPQLSVTRSGTKKDGISCCQILLLSLLLSFPMTQSRATRERRQGLWDTERPFRTVTWFCHNESKTASLKPTWKSERLLWYHSPLPKILDCKEKPRDQKDQKDLGGRRHRTTEKRKDAHSSQPVEYKPVPFTGTPSVFKCFVVGFLGRWELAGLLGLGI